MDNIDRPFATVFFITTIFYFIAMFFLVLFFQVPFELLLTFGFILIYLLSALIHLLWCKLKEEDIRKGEMIVVLIGVIVLTGAIVTEHISELAGIVAAARINFRRLRLLLAVVGLISAIAGVIWRFFRRD